MSYPCEVCGRPFSTPGNRSRHKKQMHSTSTDEGRLTVIGNRSSVMQHPYVKSLLENAQTTINYGQWQPSYFDMMRTMPGIEFNQGIPDDIDNVDYLDA